MSIRDGCHGFTAVVCLNDQRISPRQLLPIAGRLSPTLAPILFRGNVNIAPLDIILQLVDQYGGKN